LVLGRNKGVMENPKRIKKDLKTKKENPTLCAQDNCKSESPENIKKIKVNK
jgi:hypothetical protein